MVLNFSFLQCLGLCPFLLLCLSLDSFCSFPPLWIVLLLNHSPKVLAVGTLLWGPVLYVKVMGCLSFSLFPFTFVLSLLSLCWIDLPFSVAELVFIFSQTFVLLVPGFVLDHKAISSLAFSVNKLSIELPNILVAAFCPDQGELCLGLSSRQPELRFFKNIVHRCLFVT